GSPRRPAAPPGARRLPPASGGSRAYSAVHAFRAAGGANKRALRALFKMDDARNPARPNKHGTQAWRDREVAALAGRQRTLVTHEQLLDLGAGRAAIWRAAQRARLHRVHHGVYSLVKASARPPLAAEQAATLACGPHAVLSHASAAALWGLLPAPPDPVQLTLAGVLTGRSRPGIEIHLATALDDRDVRRHHGLPVTAPARLLLEMTPSLSGRALERMVDEALARRLTSRTAIVEMLDRYPGRAGTGTLRELVQPGRHSTFTRSEAEERMLALIRRGGLDPPECNVTIGGLEVDFLWRREKLVVEVDGYAFHGDAAAFERDRRRDAELRKAGFVVIRITWRQLTRTPEEVLVWIATELARR
ncbi:MAG: DUF559 domain-containing protein, partial [Solirubrobacteraceae bacterium]